MKSSTGTYSISILISIEATPNSTKLLLMAGYLVFNFTKKIVILGLKYMNFLPIPTSIKLSVSCQPLTLCQFFCSPLTQQLSPTVLHSLLKLQLWILTTLSSLHLDTLKTRFKNKANEQQNQNSPSSLTILLALLAHF